MARLKAPAAHDAGRQGQSRYGRAGVREHTAGQRQASDPWNVSLLCAALHRPVSRPLQPTLPVGRSCAAARLRRRVHSAALLPARNAGPNCWVKRRNVANCVPASDRTSPSASVVDQIPELDLMSKGQRFPRGCAVGARSVVFVSPVQRTDSLGPVPVRHSPSLIRRGVSVQSELRRAPYGRYIGTGCELTRVSTRTSGARGLQPKSTPLGGGLGQAIRLCLRQPPFGRLRQFRQSASDAQYRFEQPTAEVQPHQASKPAQSRLVSTSPWRACVPQRHGGNLMKCSKAMAITSTLT